VLALNARFPDAYHNRGIAYANVGKFDEAIEDYNRVIAMKSKDPNIFLSRGVAFTKKAMEDFRRACDMGSQLACDKPETTFTLMHLKADAFHHVTELRNQFSYSRQQERATEICNPLILFGGGERI